MLCLACRYTTFPFASNITIFCYTSLLSIAWIKIKQLLESITTACSVTIAPLSTPLLRQKSSSRGHGKITSFKFSNTLTSWYLPSLTYYFCSPCCLKSTMLNCFLESYYYRMCSVRVTSHLPKLCSQSSYKSDYWSK